MGLAAAEDGTVFLATGTENVILEVREDGASRIVSRESKLD